MIGYLEEPGVWHQTPEEDKARAVAWARRNKGRLLSGAEKSLTLEPIMRDFFGPSGAWRKRMAAKGQTLSDRHLSNYDAMVRNYLIPLFGDADPRELTARYIDDILLETKSKSGRELASGTKYKILHAFTVILGDLAETGVIPSNPLQGVKPYSKAPIRPRTALPREVLEALFPPSHSEAVRVWGRSMWAAFFVVLYDTGMRPGEARALTWESVYEEEGAVVIRRAEKAGGGIGATKTGVVRAGRLSARALQELAIWRMESRHSADKDLVFTLDGRAPITSMAATYAFRAGVKAIGKEKEGASWTPYYLRHSFVTYSLAALDSREVALLAGHSEAISQAVYSHPDDKVVLERTKAARKKLDSKPPSAGSSHGSPRHRM